LGSFRFLHAADLHLDSPMRGLSEHVEAPTEELRGATRRALVRLVELARSQAVDFVVLAGDLFDGDWRDYSTGMYLNRQLAQLECPVYCLTGNHDAESVISRTLQWPDNVLRFDVNRPQTILLEQHRVALHGQGFANRREDRNLAAGYPEPVPGYFNLGVLHTSADGREGHETYAPCTTAELVGKGYHYWALGHVHQRELLCEDPPVVFPGCLQGRHVRETGPKGCYVVSVDDGRISLDFQALDVVRWEHLDLDMAQAQTAEEAMTLVSSALKELSRRAETPLVALRLTLTGATPAHEALTRRPYDTLESLRNEALKVQRIWLEEVRVRTRPMRSREQLLLNDLPLAELMRSVAALEPGSAALAELLRPVEDLRDKLPAALKGELLSLANQQCALADVEELLWANLEAR
jgi:exonuclease SbcD